ncbi:ROK family protein [Streptomyces sp. RKAG337]|uniref:ROK family protein n=1 Tax=Streptomyces sp. RKAG337 TaxID=2893404 RepID=UPI0020341D34|nr:ROK family transcriptional regulator [Streptomyces sp. RKAG337]MCM2430870.1 ROK family protein [Streptomyces sp. RKAG337]
MRPVSSGAVDFIDVRETNLAVVLRFIRREAPCSRAEVAAGTGLNKATISNIVAELITRGIVVEVGASEERRIGRPAVMLTLDGRRFTALGLEVNVDYLSAVMVDLAERDVLTWHEPVQAAELGAEGCVVRLADLARRAMGEMARQHREVLGITIAVPGLIGTSDGEVAEAPNLGWHEFPLVDRFREQLDDSSVALSLDNDANLGAVGEYRRGALAHTQNLVYLTGEVGVGGGVIINGALMRGSSGYGGEVGHITLMQDGPLCGCGRRGCFEALVGIGSIIQQAAPDLAGSTAQPLTDLAAKVAEVARRAEAGDPRTTAALVRVGEWLGRGSAILLNLFNPQALILGGYFVTLAPWIMPPARRTLAAHTIAPNLGGCQVALSTLGFTAAARGGASSIIDAIDTARLPLPRGGSAAHR